MLIGIFSRGWAWQVNRRQGFGQSAYKITTNVLFWVGVYYSIWKRDLLHCLYESVYFLVPFA